MLDKVKGIVESMTPVQALLALLFLLLLGHIVMNALGKGPDVVVDDAFKGILYAMLALMQRSEGPPKQG